MVEFHQMGFVYRKARVPHTCWGCGATIPIGDKYWRSVVVYGKHIATIKTCRVKCETIPDMIDQNQSALTGAVFAASLPAYLEQNPDTLKD